ncbi:porin [Hyphococcus sp.]|uniref:porin n=1 Tax=Hyphococcus sp. TaxID=2038636 RepID=UPI0035C76453
MAGLIFIATPALAETEASSWNSDFKINPGGRIHLDTLGSFSSQDVPSSFDVELRRLRLSLEASFKDETLFDGEINISEDGDVDATSLFIEYAPESASYSFLLGQFKTPNSFDEMSSSNDVALNERAAFTSVFGFDRRLGAALRFDDGRNTVMAGAFTKNINEGAFDGGYALGARATTAPVMTENQILHLGASLRFRKSGGESDRFDYELDPMAPKAGLSPLQTAAQASSDMFAGFEIAGLTGNLWAAGEYAYLAPRETAQSIVGDFHAGYIEAGFSLGGRQTYEGGELGGRTVDAPFSDGGPGALFTAIRYDHIDFPGTQGKAGRQMITLGVDWFASENFALRFNLYCARTRGLTPPLPASEPYSRKETGFSLRSQFLF